MSQRKEKRKAILIYIFYQVTEECFEDLRLEEIIKSYSLKNKSSLYHFCLRTEVIWDSSFIRTQKLMVLGWHIHKKDLIHSLAYYWHQWRRLLRVGMASVLPLTAPWATLTKRSWHGQWDLLASPLIAGRKLKSHLI